MNRAILHLFLIALAFSTSGLAAISSLQLWHSCRWDPISSSSQPNGSVAQLEIHAMNNEFRSDVLNVTNTGGTANATVRIEDLPEGTTVEVYKNTSGPLNELEYSTSTTVSIPGGTSQLVFRLCPKDVDAGVYDATISMSVGNQSESVPLHFQVYAPVMPAQTTMIVGGWDYSDPGGYGDVKDTKFPRFMQRYGVNGPWAQASVIPTGSYDGSNNLVPGSISTSNFDAWMAKWPDARRYHVFFAAATGFNRVVPTTFLGASLGSAACEARTASWAKFWEDYMESKGRKAEDLAILWIDEIIPETQATAAATWNRAFDKAGSKIIKWNNPFATNPSGTGFEQLAATTDVMCPHRWMWFFHGAKYQNYFLNLPDSVGRAMYATHQDPTGQANPLGFDPYAFNLAQAWQVFAIAGSESHYWRFGGNTDAFTPYYPGPVLSKQMLAINEGIYDFEYLTMLKDHVAANPSDTEAEQLLNNATNRVIGDITSGNILWGSYSGDRTRADQVRKEILAILPQNTGAVQNPKPMGNTSGRASAGGAGLSMTISSNRSVDFDVQLRESAGASLCVYNVAGQRIWQYNLAEHAGASSYEVQWDFQDAGSSVYVVALQRGNRIIGKKLLLTK